LKIARPQRRVRLLLELVRIHKVIDVIDADPIDAREASPLVH
jgi:hypothetical protein